MRKAIFSRQGGYECSNFTSANSGGDCTQKGQDVCVPWFAERVEVRVLAHLNPLGRTRDANVFKFWNYNLLSTEYTSYYAFLLTHAIARDPVSGKGRHLPTHNNYHY